MSTEGLLYIILAGIGALLLATLQYIFKQEKRRLNVLLGFFRFITYFLILLLLINPKFEKIDVFNEKPNLIIAVDNSESIAHLGKTQQSDTTLNAIRNSDLSNKFNLSFYSFGTDTKILDSLDYNDGQTEINELFRELGQVYQDKPSPMILVTDGNQTIGTDYEFGSSSYKHPIFPIILGDTVSYSDLKISKLNVNKYAYLKNKFPVEIFVNYSGNSAVNSSLVVTKNGRRLYSENLQFDEGTRSKRLNIQLTAENVGVSTYNAYIVPLESERNTVNNSKPFAIEVIDQKTNVAIVSSISHPDLGSLKKSIESNEQRSVEILKPSEYLRDIEKFQLVVLYQPDPSFNSVLQRINEASLNYFLIGGTSTNWATINSQFSGYEQEITRQTEDFQADLNSNYGAFIVDDLDFSSLPPLKGEFGEFSIFLPHEPILFKSISGTVIQEPLLFTLEQNNRREAVLLGENIWRWRAQSYLNSGSFQLFDTFMGKLVQYLASSSKRSRLNINYESFYNGNADIEISAQFFNRNYEFDNKANLEILLKNKETDANITLPFVIKQNNYSVDLSGMDPGSYDFTVNANNGEARRSGSFTILDYNVEQQFLNADLNKLNAIAEKSGGLAIFSGDEPTLIEQLNNDERFATIQKSTKNVVPLIDFKIILALLALSLAAEWFIRKYNGLI